MCIFVFNAALMSDPVTPATIHEALSGPEKDKWRESALSEINNFMTRGSWKKVKREEVAERRRKKA
jgi:hypothetical protein